MNRKNPMDIVKYGTDAELVRLGNIDQLNEYIDRDTPNLLRILPEGHKSFNKETPKEVIYQRIGKLDARRLVSCSGIDLSYLKSSLRAYKRLLPLIKDHDVRGWVKFTLGELKQTIRSVKTSGRHRHHIESLFSQEEVEPSIEIWLDPPE